MPHDADPLLESHAYHPIDSGTLLPYAVRLSAIVSVEKSSDYRKPGSLLLLDTGNEVRIATDYERVLRVWRRFLAASASSSDSNPSVSPNAPDSHV